MNRKRLLLLVLILIIGALFIKTVDVFIKYRINGLEYLKYSRELSKEEKRYLKDNTLVFLAGNDPPLTFINDYNNQSTGILIDYVSQLSIEIESNINIIPGEEKRSTASGNGVAYIEAIESTGENQKRYSFTEPFFTVEGKIIVKTPSEYTDVGSLQNITLAVLKDEEKKDTTEDQFKGNRNVKIIEVDNLYQGFALMRNDQAQAFLGDDIKLAYFLYVTSQGNQYRFLDGALYEREVRLAVEKDNDILLNILNKGILSMEKKNLIVQTQSKWLGGWVVKGMDLRRLSLIYRVVLVILVIVASFSGWNYVITRRVNQKTRELRESKEELRLIIDTMDRGILVVDKDGAIIECNDAITKMTGLSRQDLLGNNYRTVTGLTPFFAADNLETPFRLGDSYYDITKRDFQGNSKMLIMLEDYTEKAVNEKRRRQEAKMVAIGQLSAGLAHEIRNPLGLIKSYSFVIKKYCVDQMGTHALAIINESIDRVNQLIDNLLRFSRLSNEEKKPVDVEQVMKLILELEEKNLLEKGIKVHSDVQNKDRLPVWTNEDVLKMIFINLIGNSIDALEETEKEEKVIQIHISIEGEQMILAFSDNGCGIEKDEIENIFNPFYSTKETGTGLGLYLIGTEVANIGGHVAVESLPGEGTRFEISLKIDRKEN